MTRDFTSLTVRERGCSDTKPARQHQGGSLSRHGHADVMLTGQVVLAEGVASAQIAEAGGEVDAEEIVYGAV